MKAVSTSDYQREHTFLVDELRKCGKKGEFLAEYFYQIDWYKAQDTWARNKIRALEIQSVLF